MVSAFLKAWIWEGANRFWERFWGKRQKEGCENAEIGGSKGDAKNGCSVSAKRCAGRMTRYNLRMRTGYMVDRILNICLELAAAPINNSVSIDEIKSSAWF